MNVNANIISIWEVITMDEWTMQANFMRLAHCVTYGTCRDWLSSENTGLRSPWHYSKCDVFAQWRLFKRYKKRMGRAGLAPTAFVEFTVYNVADHHNIIAIVDKGHWVFLQDCDDYFMNNTIWAMYGLIIGIDSSTGALMGTTGNTNITGGFEDE